MTFETKEALRECIRADLYRYTGRTDRAALRRCRRASAGFRMTYYMRLCSYTRHRPLQKMILFPIYKLRMRRAGEKVGAEMHEDMQIGKGLHIAHSGCIVLHRDAVLGENVSISHGVTVGQTLKDGKAFVPVIGSNVYIAPGAKVIGGIRVGDNVAIGANAVVTRDVPSGAVVAGCPARVLSMDGAGDYVQNPYSGGTERA